MSEYQYYEFLALDQPLTDKQMLEVRKFSGRAKITPTSFVNEYNYGDFRGDIKTFLTKYYDAFVYVANWGTHRLCFRLPVASLDAEAVKQYCPSDHATLRVTGESAILTLCSENEQGGWEKGVDWMPSLSPLRANLLAGDLRCLYLGWLSCVGRKDADVDKNEAEPPVPPGLGDLTAPLRSLAEFLRIDASLIETAAEASAVSDAEDDSAGEFKSWIVALPADNKDSLLCRLAEESPIGIQREILRRFREARPAQQRAPLATGRTAGQLLSAWNHRRQEKLRLEVEKKSAAEVRQKEEAPKARQKYLDELALRGPQAWKKAQTLIKTRQPKSYDQAVQLLADLRDLAERQGRSAEAASLLQALRDEHANKPSMCRRLDEAKL